MMTEAPWWFLDVDGVVNAFPPPPPGATTWSYRTVEVPAAGRTFAVTVAEEVLDFLRDVHTTGRAEIVWCTTWGEDARASLAPRLDLPEWPVAPYPEGVRCAPLPGWSALPWWKVEAISRWLDAEPRPYAFTDDDLVPAPGEDLRSRHPDLAACLLRPSATLGLTEEDLSVLDHFLKEHAG